MVCRFKSRLTRYFNNESKFKGDNVERCEEREDEEDEQEEKRGRVVGGRDQKEGMNQGGRCMKAKGTSQADRQVRSGNPVHQFLAIL